jgi:catechol 2,3-dioxygenase-like lactoylglutathione lyase family enzyme
MKLGQVIVFAKDLHRMHAFYRDELGLTTIDGAQPDEWVQLDAGGVILALHAIPSAYATSIRIDDPPKPRTETALKLIFHVEDVRATRDKLSAAGAPLRELRELGQGRLSCDCLDPEGNVFRIATPPRA